MSKEIQKWADDAMYQAEPMEQGEHGVKPRAYLLSATPDPLGAIAAACAMYEGRVVRDTSEVTDEQRRHYWEQVKKTHLKAPLEFVDLHFLLEGVTRSFTHQLVRQRTAVYAQESLRFAVKEHLSGEVPLPPSIQPGSMGHERGEERQVWEDAIEQVDAAYNRLINMGVPAEDARGLLPHSVTTRVHYKTNLRNLLDHAGNRLCTQAQFEWRYVFAQIVQAIREHRPQVPRTPMGVDITTTHDWQFQLIANDGLFKPVCYAVGHCPFTADFDRGCTIRERVQRGEWDKIDDTEWLLDPAAARRDSGRR